MQIDHIPNEKSAAAQTQKLLGSLWTRNLPVIRERLLLLDRAAEIARSATLTYPLRRDAAMTAHKLAGSLGMFGYIDGTDIARRLELLLDDPSDPDPDRLSSLAADLRHSLHL